MVTNEMKINEMDGEELAEFLEKFDACDVCEYYVNKRCTFETLCTHGFAEAMIYKWLKSEAKE